MAATQCIYSCRHDENKLLQIEPSTRMEKKGDLKAFECVVGVRQAGQRISQTWIFTQPSLRFTENGPKRRGYPVKGSQQRENAFVMPEVREKWTG